MKTSDAPKTPGHPFHPGTPRRALLAMSGLLSTAYFVWWGCFAVVLPLGDACGGLCCATCECCGADVGKEPYCTEPDKTCAFTCEPGTTEFACFCEATNSQNICTCRGDGTYDPCGVQFNGGPGDAGF